MVKRYGGLTSLDDDDDEQKHGLGFGHRELGNVMSMCSSAQADFCKMDVCLVPTDSVRQFHLSPVPIDSPEYSDWDMVLYRRTGTMSKYFLHTSLQNTPLLSPSTLTSPPPPPPPHLLLSPHANCSLCTQVSHTPCTCRVRRLIWRGR